MIKYYASFARTALLASWTLTLVCFLSSVLMSSLSNITVPMPFRCFIRISRFSSWPVRTNMRSYNKSYLKL